VAISKRAALQLPCVAIPTQRWTDLCVSTPIKRLFNCLRGVSDARWGLRPISLNVLLTMYKIIRETLVKNGRINWRYSHKSCRFCKMHGKFWVVIVTVVIQHIGFVKPLSFELQKSSCDLVQADANRRKIVISKQRTEAVHYDLCKCAVANCWNSQRVTREDRAQPPLITRRVGQLLKLIRQRHTSEGMCFTHLLITSLATSSDTSQMK